MKIYVREKSVTLVGKSWEIRRKLAEYASTYKYVLDWINANK